MRASLTNSAGLTIVLALLVSACGSADGDVVAESAQDAVKAGETWEQYDKRRDS